MKEKSYFREKLVWRRGFFIAVRWAGLLWPLVLPTTSCTSPLCVCVPTFPDIPLVTFLVMLSLLSCLLPSLWDAFVCVGSWRSVLWKVPRWQLTICILESQRKTLLWVLLTAKLWLSDASSLMLLLLISWLVCGECTEEGYDVGLLSLQKLWRFLISLGFVLKSVLKMGQNPDITRIPQNDAWCSPCPHPNYLGTSILSRLRISLIFMYNKQYRVLALNFSACATCITNAKYSYYSKHIQASRFCHVFTKHDGWRN